VAAERISDLIPATGPGRPSCAGGIGIPSAEHESVDLAVAVAVGATVEVVSTESGTDDAVDAESVVGDSAVGLDTVAWDESTMSGVASSPSPQDVAANTNVNQGTTRRRARRTDQTFRLIPPAHHLRARCV
jgi:hypothetical protein